MLGRRLFAPCLVLVPNQRRGWNVSVGWDLELRGAWKKKVVPKRSERGTWDTRLFLPLWTELLSHRGLLSSVVSFVWEEHELAAEPTTNGLAEKKMHWFPFLFIQSGVLLVPSLIFISAPVGLTSPVKQIDKLPVWLSARASQGTEHLAYKKTKNTSCFQFSGNWFDSLDLEMLNS